MTQDSQFWALAVLAARATAITGGKLRLGHGVFSAFDDNTPQATFAAQVAVYQGYADIVLPAPGAAYQDGDHRYSIQVPTQQFQYVAGGPNTPDIVTFAWVEDAAANVIQWFSFPTPILMDNNLSAIPIDLKFSESTVAVP